MFKELILWSEQNYSYLPWRKNRSLYNTLVSEIMLQQTTVGTVLNHFEQFIMKYPTIFDLANISEEQILIDWKGLGYYRRARNLLNAAKEIVENYGGEIPTDYTKLVSIKGIGAYTANAIISIGAKNKALSVDANLERVLSRLYGLKSPKGTELQKSIYEKFNKAEICHEDKGLSYRALNESIMDLGRTTCRARSTNCELCPMKSNCYSFKNNTQNSLPISTDKKTESTLNKYLELSLLRLIIKNEKGEFLTFKKSSNQWLTGQYELPTFILSSDDEKLNQYPKIKDKDRFFYLDSFKTSITKYKITNYILHSEYDEIYDYLDTSTKYEWSSNIKVLSTSSQKALRRT